MSELTSRPLLSLVLPVFNEEQTLGELDRRIRELLDPLDVTWEVVLVDDGSRDRSRAILNEMASRDDRYKVVGLSRNFGHQIAITAGIDYADGDAVVVMDADLQDPPEVVVEMIQKWRAGSDVVYAVRTKRHGESWFKRLTAAVFYRLLRRLTGFSIPVDVGDFRLMSRKVVLTLRSLREKHRFVRGMVVWVGFKQTAVEYERARRFAGETKYPLRKMVRFAIDGIASFSTAPLQLAIWLGSIAGVFAVGAAGWAVYSFFTNRATVPGWTALMVLVAFSSTAQLIVTGILGEYVGRIYEEVKRRPLYAVDDVKNLGGRTGGNPDPRN
ncbi:MAG: glycosyltransferase family 2 protein [Deltaproteobacteria bacterium]|nr:glycosyltransferase family 2 protein [Deltaproteobacteria bacterium]